MTVFRRKDGRWVARVNVGGRRKDFYGRTAQEARQKATDYLRRLGLRPIPQPGKRTLKDLLEAYLATSDLRPRTVKDYEDVARLYLGPILGVRLADLEPVHVLLVLEPLRGRPRSALKTFRILHRLLNYAVRLGYLTENPCDRVDPPKYAPTRRRLWNVEELGLFLAASRDHRLHPLFLLLATTGLRIGEALALRWSDLDLEAGMVHVRRNLQRIRGRWIEQPPKTRAGGRTVVLPPQAVGVLRHHRVRSIEAALREGRSWSEEAWAFCGLDGGPLYEQTVISAMKAIARRAGLPLEAAHPHALRHAHASILLSQGVGLANVSRRLGHASAAVTAAVYSHAVREDRELATLVERTLRLGEEVR